MPPRKISLGKLEVTDASIIATATGKICRNTIWGMERRMSSGVTPRTNNRRISTTTTGRTTATSRKIDLLASKRFPEIGLLNQKAVLPTVESFCTSCETITVKRQTFRIASGHDKEDRETIPRHSPRECCGKDPINTACRMTRPDHTPR